MKKIIFSEGHAFTIDMICEELDGRYELTFAPNKDVLFEKLHAAKFDLVLLNVLNGGRILGMHLVPEIKAMGFTVAMFTWSADEHTIQECRKVDLDGFIAKGDRENWIADIEDLLRGERVFPDFFSTRKWKMGRLYSDAPSRIRSSRSANQTDLVDKLHQNTGD